MAVPVQARRYLASEDYEVKRSRQSSNLIQHYEDLTKYEKIALIDLLGGYAGMHAGHEVHGGGSRLYQEFIRLIFRECLKVGVLDKDHPEPNTTRRHINWPEDDDLPVLAPFVTETSSIPPKSKHRKVGRPIYLGLTLNLEQEYYSWLWRDQGRQFVNPQHVRPATASLSIMTAARRSVSARGTIRSLLAWSLDIRHIDLFV
ncbi:hypothetical protein BHE90_017184 [Fusarium euwallaceae]|uniref:Uncharacterized protein n=1 Tax=Fusarium euwallaceae TaxID=1147111 RepID=A0A430KY71_9HYPO|nr:hypothetical protein BHE90_017184 [Fusarium euwallaceae]